MRVCLPKEKGGLGIRDLRKFNYALLGKWKWSFFHNKGELWARLLESKYGNWRNLEEATRGSRVSTWWKDINIRDPSGADGNVFDKGIKWKVGCGEKAKFLEDGWKDDGVPLKVKYPHTVLCVQTATTSHKDDGHLHSYRLGMGF